MATYPVKILKDEDGRPFVPLTSLDAVSGEKHLQYILNAVQTSPGHFRVTYKDLETKDLVNSIIVVRWPKITSTVKPSYLQLNQGTEFILYNGAGTEYLDLEDASQTVNMLACDGEKWILTSGAGSGSGHVITDEKGDTLEQQKILNFVGFNVENDTANRATKIINPDPISNLTTSESGKGALDAYQGYILAGRSIPTGGATGQVLAKKNGSDYQVEWVTTAGDNAIDGDGSITKIVGLTYEEYKELESRGEIDPTTQYHITDVGAPGNGVVSASDVQLNDGNTLDNKLENIDIINEGQNTRLDIAEGNIDTIVSTVNTLSSSKGRINDAMTITFADDTLITYSSTAWGHTPVPFNTVLANTNSSLYTLTNGKVKVSEGGTYLVSGTLNCDSSRNWSIMLTPPYTHIINDVRYSDGGMVNANLSPFVVQLAAGEEIGLMTRCDTASVGVNFRCNRSYFTIIKLV